MSKQHLGETRHSNVSASKYTDFSVFSRILNTIYGQNLKNTDKKRTKEGVASITTNGEFQRDTEKLHKILKNGGPRTDKCND